MIPNDWHICLENKKSSKADPLAPLLSRAQISDIQGKHLEQVN